MCGLLSRIIVTYAYICFSIRSTDPDGTRFYAEWNAPLPHFRVQNFGDMLDARLLSTLCRSTSELLRTL